MSWEYVVDIREHGFDKQLYFNNDYLANATRHEVIIKTKFKANIILIEVEFEHDDLVIDKP